MNWPSVAIKDVARVIGGATPKTSTPSYWDGDVNWATPKDLANLPGKCIAETPRRITVEGLRSCAAELLPPNSVLFSSRAPIGHVAINTTPMATNQGFKSVIPGLKLDPSFLYWWLDTNRERLQALGNGATFKEVSKAVVERIEIPLPPLEEQKRLAALLDQADALRRLRRRAIDRLDTLGQAIFHEMFGDPFSKSGQNQTAGLKDLTTRITYGFTCPMSHHQNGIPIVTAKNVRDGYIDFTTCAYAAANEFDALTDKSRPDAGDILITKDGSIGRYSVFNEDFPVCINQSVALIKPDKEKVIPAFLAAYFGSFGAQSRFQRMKKGNALPHLQITELAEFPIFNPSLDQQRELAERLGGVTATTQRLRSHFASLERLFFSLQHRAFSGTP